MSVECIDQLNGRFRGPIQAEREIAVGAPKILRHCSRVSGQNRKRSVWGTMGGQVLLTEGTMNCQRTVVGAGSVVAYPAGQRPMRRGLNKNPNP